METVVLTVKEVDNYNYLFIDEKNNKEYKLNIEFVGKDIDLKIKDTIVLSSKLLDEKYEEYSTSYTFGDLDEISGRKVIEENKQDIILVITNNEKHFLKRLYG